MISQTLLVLFVFFTAVVNGKTFFLGCPKPSVVQNFKPALYLGRWYLQQRYFNSFESFGRCTTADHSVSGLYNFGVKNTQVDLVGTSTSIEGTAYPTNNNIREGKYIVNFPTTYNVWGNYWILDTDYVKYAIVWACRDYWAVSDHNLWIMTRDKNAGVNDLAGYRDIAYYKGVYTWPLLSISQNC